MSTNRAWSWFEDERAIVVDIGAGKLLLSSVASGSGTGGPSRDGNVALVADDLATGDIQRAVLHPALHADDHNSAALHVRPDSPYVAMSSNHATDPAQPLADYGPSGDDTALERKRTSTTARRPRRSAVRICAGRRTRPHAIVSDDGVSSWRQGGRLLDGPGRPSVRSATGGAGRIHVVTTDPHPADYANRIYHGVVVDGQLVRSDGTVVDGDVFDAHAVAPPRLSEMHRGTGRDLAWTIDLAVDGRGRPFAFFSVSTEPSGVLQVAPGVAGTHRYHYARHDGTAWSVHSRPRRPCGLPRRALYTGLIALDPHDPHRVFVSTDVHPSTGGPLVSATVGRRHRELFEGETTNGGAKWQWRPITADSTVDNIRQIVPAWDPSDTVPLWLRGSYATYHDYDLDVVGMITSKAV